MRHVEERRQAVPRFQIVRATPPRDVELALLELTKERLVIEPEVAVQDVGSCIAVEEKHVHVRELRGDRRPGGEADRRRAILRRQRARDRLDAPCLDRLEQYRESK